MNKFFSIINKLKKSNLDFRTIKEIEEIKILKGKILSELQNLNDSNNLNDREFKVFSQFGEDGIAPTNQATHHYHYHYQPAPNAYWHKSVDHS